MTRKSTPLKAAILLTAILFGPYASPGNTAAQGLHDHAGAADSQHALKLDHGRKWATDPALRQGMSQIRSSLAQRLEAAHGDKLTPSQYRTVAGEISQQVAYIVRDCKLEPTADAVLHGIIAELLAAADTMNGKTPGTPPRTGFVRALDALDDYGKHFEHPRWVALKH